jgi:hypothetical protein
MQLNIRRGIKWDYSPYAIFCLKAKSVTGAIVVQCLSMNRAPNYFAGVRLIFSAAVVFVILPSVVLVGNSDILVLLEELE